MGHLNLSMSWLSTYLNTKKEKMEMTTPVLTRKADGEKMEMTTPVITKRLQDQEKWQMSFVMPAKYGADLPLPKDPSVRIKEVPSKVVAVIAFSDKLDKRVKRTWNCEFWRTQNRVNSVALCSYST
ncbi:hypothetical protein ACOSQ2_018957 [Xanthoceras sorbifolium]